MSADPRQHHLQMKYLVAQMALEYPERFFATFGPGGDSAHFAKVWTAIGERLPPEERVPNTGAATWSRSEAGRPEILVLTLPPASRRNEAHFIAIIRASNRPCRVFCLERVDPAGPVGGLIDAFLVELTAGGRANWGPGHVTTPAAFAEAVERIFGGASQSPIAVSRPPR